MLNDFDAHKTIAEAGERHEQTLEHSEARAKPGRHARWVPLSAALLAVIAAIASLISNKSATEALAAKNDAILLRTEASDTYNFFESKSIKQHIYEAAVAADPAMSRAVRAKLEAVVAHEKSEGAPLLERARGQEERAKKSNERSEQLTRAREVLEGAVTLFEVAIAIVSISALTSSTFLVGFGALAALCGLFLLLYGQTLR